MELIRLNPACISCLLKNRLEDFPKDTPHEKQIEYMQRVLKAVIKMFNYCIARNKKRDIILSTSK